MARPTAGRLRRALLAGLVATATALVGLPAGAITPDPSPWPTGTGVDPGIDSAAHGLRMAGPDRTQTALSAALILRGTGGYPFSSPDRTAGVDAATGLADASSWWGLGTCPYSVIITAADTAADSLAAASLSDPTDGSSEPLLRRSASADPSFDPVGGFARVDTETAPILVTAAARQGATKLSAATRVAAHDLADGGCQTARNAIVVGGTNAVPAGVDTELLDLGYNQVFRVAGESRYGTAASIATALGTGDAQNGTACADPVVSDSTADLGFHGNAAVEYRTSAVHCEVLGRTVVLADGLTGADALAAGWWTSTWQVPVLLTDGDGGLPAETRDALATLEIEHVVVLGGEGRIPEATVEEAAQLAGAETLRVAGVDRYDTSVEMARIFGGWYPTDDGHDYAGSAVCLAASSGVGASSVGWPDALGAGPWCAAASVGGDTANIAPVRALSPTDGARPRTSGSDRAAHVAVPVLLTPAGGGELAPSVADFLAETFDPATLWCTSTAETVNSCADPGFVFAFGGTAVVSDDAFHQGVRAVSGETYVVTSDRFPRLDVPFFTQLDMTPVYATGGASDSAVGRFCLPRDGAAGVRWLAAYDDAGAHGFDRQYDVMLTRLYRRDADGVARRPGALAPVCLGFAGDDDQTSALFGVSLSGEFSEFRQVAYGPANRLTLSQRLTQVGPAVASGADTTTDDAGEMTALTFRSDSPETSVTSREQPASVNSWAIEVLLHRGANLSEPVEPDAFTANLSLSTTLGTVTAQGAGEAVFDGAQWHLRGETSFTGGTWNVAEGTGGFVADLVVGESGMDDDTISWVVDGVVVDG